MKVIVVQRGARHRYAVPRLLYQAGCLEALYTDSNGSYGAGKLLGSIPSRFLPDSARRLVQREIADLPPEMVRFTDTLSVLGPIVRRLSNSRFDFDSRHDRIFSSVIRRWGVGEATMIYSMFGEGWSFIEAAKKQGLKIALDMFVNPVTHRILDEERRAFPDWEAQDESGYEALEEDLNRRISVADLLLCPADAVADGLRYYSSFSEEKVRVVPYGFAGDIEPQGSGMVKRRILFGGAASLRKGIHYLAKAAEILSERDHGCEFRVAGPVTETVRNKPECRFLTFLGALPRAGFVAELHAADLFVLPTLAEGSATVIYEALACGVPVVTTRSAGSVVTDGVEGLIVPERDSQALADAIAMITARRSLRDGMSASAIQTAKKFSEARWGERLVQALKSVSEPV